MKRQSTIKGRTSRFVLAVTVCSLVLSLLPTSRPRASSQAISPSIGVNPALVRRNVAPGESVSTTIRLTNYGSDVIPIGVAKANVSGIDEQGTPEITNVVSPRSASDWVTPATADIIVPPEGQKEIEVTIAPPRSTPPGGYNTALIFQAKLPSYYFDLDATARILPALSVSFLLSVGADDKTATNLAALQISKLEAPKLVVAEPVPLVSELRNSSGFFIYPDGELTIKPLLGEAKTVAKLSGTVLLPEATRKYVNVYSDKVWPNIYQATLKLTSEDGQVLVASARFVAFPWPFLLILLLLIVALVGLAARQRLRLAFLALRGINPPKTRPPSRPTLR